VRPSSAQARRRAWPGASPLHPSRRPTRRTSWRRSASATGSAGTATTSRAGSASGG